MFANVNTDLNRSFNGKDSNSNRKRAFCSAPKPDTPPVSSFLLTKSSFENITGMIIQLTPSQSAPYWNNPIWGGENNISPPMNVSQTHNYIYISVFFFIIDFVFVLQLTLELPELKVSNMLPKLSTPQVMAAIAKKGRFIFEESENVK